MSQLAFATTLGGGRPGSQGSKGGLRYRQGPKDAPRAARHADPLAQALSLFADLRDALISARQGFDAVGADPNWRWGFWTSLDFFFLLFSHFDGMRRRALGEPVLLGAGEADYRRAWGLPERDVPADLRGP